MLGTRSGCPSGRCGSGRGEELRKEHPALQWGRATGEEGGSGYPDRVQHTTLGGKFAFAHPLQARPSRRCTGRGTGRPPPGPLGVPALPGMDSGKAEDHATRLPAHASCHLPAFPQHYSWIASLNREERSSPRRSNDRLETGAGERPGRGLRGVEFGPGPLCPGFRGVRWGRSGGRPSTSTKKDLLEDLESFAHCRRKVSPRLGPSTQRKKPSTWVPSCAIRANNPHV